MSNTYPLLNPISGKQRISNKITALGMNLSVFNGPQQYEIINELLNLPLFNNNDLAKEAMDLLVTRYRHFAGMKISNTHLVQETTHWLSNCPDSLRLYEKAISDYEKGGAPRNILDDLRLSMELLLQNLLKNKSPLEKQIDDQDSSMRMSPPMYP